MRTGGDVVGEVAGRQLRGAPFGKQSNCELKSERLQKKLMKFKFEIEMKNDWWMKN